ncbi:hypothetical protein BS50DRAFT_593277 [Corynespora cassiicola Philippines]|uniref:Peptidase S59 domain-containing protein n=1 Tax=Corynespora cassiicola Philippines TaxID=1448308 RepID=A0A2T2N6Q1_CORCC|nr:hypothetical protein BS50DRAFT_593277 [Corynespora cassiicola Philippines]
MSFGSGGFGGFGTNNTQSTFGGFGSNNNNTNTAGASGFGSNTSTGGSVFGQSANNTSGSVFGTNASTSSPFGSGGGFGSNTNTTTGFGSKPFGASTGGGLFGGGGSTSNTFGGFGSTSNNTNTTSAFGGGTAGGGLFGGNQNKTGFGSSTTGASSGGGLFGNTSTSFGTNNTAGGFGSSTTGGFGGAAANTPNNGTATTPFNAYTEKDGAASNSTQHYQTITFQQPYQNYSLEELRLADYNQGRRYGNQNGQAGAFGQSTGFGGFGTSNTNTSTGFGSNANTNTSGSLFGAGANTGTSAFGQSSGSAFGANTNNNSNASGGGLFGQNKTGGLFGSAATSQPSSGGGLFGGNANSTTTSGTGAFGSGSGSGGFGSASTGGGLFGGQNNQTNNQAKPFGGFGSNTNTTSTSFGGSGNAFGQSSNTGGGLFGQNNQSSSTPGFGSSQQTANTGGGLFGGNTGNTGGGFGQTQQNQNQGQPSGGLFGGGFGQNAQQSQQKPGGLFGSSTTNTGGGGLFGNANTTNSQPQQSGGLFGNSSTQNAGTSLFGQKPAATGTGLFGNTSTNTGGTSSGLFGNLGGQTNQQSTGSGLFGGQTQQKPGGLFGSSTTNTNAGGLFGSQNNAGAPALGGSLFGGQPQPQQSQQPGMGNSLFGASGTSLLQTSMNTNPYGNDALFSGLNTPTQSPGPLATPLSSNQKHKKSAILPQYKLNPSASTRLLSPQSKKSVGYGFSYSTYGTPTNTSSQSTPSGNLFGNSLSRSLGKSLSTSNLRNSFTPDTSILAPGAFSTNGRPSGNGSIKRLNINRAINRTPLFEGPTTPPLKRVSFAASSTENGATSNGTGTDDPTGRELVVRHEPEVNTPEVPSSSMNGELTGRESHPEVNGGGPTVPDKAPVSHPTTSVNGAGDPTPGSYWSSPSLSELKKLSKDQLKSVPDFVVGRDNIGKIEFNFGQPVDLSEVDLDKLFEDIIQLNHRNATVYGENTTVPKPQLGNGLNQPSRITLGNSWPRNRAGKKDQKHLERLKRVHGTKFEKYIPQTGEWIFTVDHFSSYGLNDDDYSDDEVDQSSELSDVPDTPAAQLGSSQMTSTPQENSFNSPTQSSPDDTFDFKKGMRKRVSVPGGFGDEVAYEEEDMEDAHGRSFLGARSVGSFESQHESDYTESGSESGSEQDMAGSVSGPIYTTEHLTARETDPFKDSVKPKSILKASQILRPNLGTPSKSQTVFDDDWANQLQRTISPKKQNRQNLRESQGNVLRDRNGAVPLVETSLNQAIPSAMDLMDSLFGEKEKQPLPAKRLGHGIELPYSKRPKTARDLDQLSGSDKDFHSCNKPHFSEAGVLIYASKSATALEDDIYRPALEPVAGAQKDIRFAQLPTFPDAVPSTLRTQRQQTKITPVGGVPFATLRTDPASLDFADMARSVALDTAAGKHEQQAWQLLSLLFDDTDNITGDTDEETQEQRQDRIRKEKLSDFWETLVHSDVEKQVQHAATSEERAIAYLSGHGVANACHALLQGLDLRLATMVAQIGGDQAMREDMASQIEEWRRMDVLSEIDDSVRAIYELLSGNCAQSQGKSAGGRENRATTFNICQRFGLGWRQAFGLRLWYGTMVDEPVELAVAQFADALRDGTENIKPTPWFLGEGHRPSWEDQDASDREDLLWGILKLYASSKLELPANIEEVLAPENVSGHPLNARLSFQLFQLFKSRYDDQDETDSRKVHMPTDRAADQGRSPLMSSTSSTNGNGDEILEELGDKITLTYAASLHTEKDWQTALWVYTHLSSPAMREHYIRSLLNLFAHKYSVVDDDRTYVHLTSELCIPTTWIHAAAALQAKTEGDALRQAMHLIKAEEFDEAHEVLCRSVGPDSIISRDYDALRELMSGFVPTPTNSPVGEGGGSVASSLRSQGRPKEPVRGWAHGGQIYFDYIELLDLTSQRSNYRVDDELNQQITELLHKLQSALEAVAKEKWGSSGLEERVALTEIAGTVAGMIAKTKVSRIRATEMSVGANHGQHSVHAKVLSLPLTEETYLRHACSLSTSYYRKVMAANM